MAPYNLERVSILLVEDNRYVRNIIQDLLRHFRFGRVSVCSNGEEAIDFLKSMGSAAMPGGTAALDIVISDLVMSPINGLLLLRWLRSAKESPNRFLPFIMLSGAADREYVNACRDLGGTEFLAKPFAVETVYRHILEVIDYPRQFVATQHYFGPDRRRRVLPPSDGHERRIAREEDAVVVYSSERVVKPQETADVWFFRLPNRLKEKAGGLGKGGGEPGDIPLDLLREAEAMLDRAALDFAQWATTYLAKLSDLCTDAVMKPGRRDSYFREINLLAHELRGQGGTFGYPLVSMFGKMLYDLTGENCREDDNAVEIVKAHIDAMRAVLREKIAGDGGKIGRDLLVSLNQALDKYSVVR
ncbi:MAG: response regulator [Magnetospirillum sp. WYHS-4]